MADSQRATYASEAADFDRFLAEKIAAIRARQEAGEITVRQAADLRVEALSHHLGALKALRAEYFPGDRDECNG